MLKSGVVRLVMLKTDFQRAQVIIVVPEGLWDRDNWAKYIFLFDCFFKGNTMVISLRCSSYTTHPHPHLSVKHTTVSL